MLARSGTESTIFPESRVVDLGEMRQETTELARFRREMSKQPSGLALSPVEQEALSADAALSRTSSCAVQAAILIGWGNRIAGNGDAAEHGTLQGATRGVAPNDGRRS